MEIEDDAVQARERAARLRAETALGARDEFLAVVSHELRGPLNGIQCWSHIIESQVMALEGADNALLLQRAVKGIKTGISQQARLIDELLDTTRMLSGKLRLLMQPLVLLPLIRSAVDEVREAAATKRIAISCEYRIADQQVEGDPRRIEQVLGNLLSNALKFTPPHGNIRVSAAGSGRFVDIVVQDDGVGIAPDLLPQLFDRFSRQEAAPARRRHGLELGLFMAQQLVALHGGSIGASSKGIGAGAAFTVTLPLLEPGNNR